jgi:hypothetical protein
MSNFNAFHGSTQQPESFRPRGQTTFRSSNRGGGNQRSAPHSSEQSQQTSSYQPQQSNGTPAFSAEGSRGGGRQRPNRGQRSRVPATISTLRRNNRIPSRQPPTAQHMSTASSEAKNDPLHAEFIIPETPNDLVPNEPRIHITSTMLEFDTLINNVYRVLSTDRTFSRNISTGMFAYYCAVQWVYRIWFLETRNFRSPTFEVSEFLRICEELQFEIPDPIATFIKGIGNITSVESDAMLYSIEELTPSTFVIADGINGWYGKISAANHYLYQWYPCLAVYAKKICVDIVGTADWDLPAIIRPDGDHGTPTPNLPGYRPTDQMSPEMTRNLNSSLITATAFPSVNTIFPINLDLLTIVRSHLLAVNKFKLTIASTFETHGSLGQVLYVTTPPNYTYMGEPFVSSTLIGNCGSRLDGRESYGSSSIIYRFKAETILNRAEIQINNWCIYSFDNYSAVPEEWINSANNLFQLPSTDMRSKLNVPSFSTARYEAIGRLSIMVDRASIAK